MRTTHAITGATYESTDDGRVRVTDRDGRVGLFHPDGRWESGELRSADPHLLDWVGGQRLRSRRLAPDAESHG